MKAISLFLLILSGVAFSEENVCVRNYTYDHAPSPCDRNVPQYTLAVHATDASIPVCVRVYPKTNCTVLDEYEYVPDVGGNQICVMNYSQKPVADNCEKFPKYYDYVLS